MTLGCKSAVNDLKVTVEKFHAAGEGRRGCTCWTSTLIRATFPSGMKDGSRDDPTCIACHNVNFLLREKAITFTGGEAR
ncbi:hypothetical protein GF325_03930 [Candidatus Bathyarchaeota archaeon]|nr:hypothetical protein [Candidatus Bathyarchaeota archaeon]